MFKDYSETAHPKLCAYGHKIGFFSLGALCIYKVNGARRGEKQEVNLPF